MSSLETKKTPIIVAYSADPWESALPILRFIGPAQHTGLTVVYGNQGADVDPDKVSGADIVVIQRDFPRFIDAYVKVMRNAHAQRKPVIYDLDDLLLELPEGHVSKPDISAVLFPILWAIIEADAVTTSTSYLRDYLRPFNSNIWLLPNYLNDQLWTFQSPQLTDGKRFPVVIGYMGGQTHSSDLESVVPVLQTLLERYVDKVVFRFWGVKPPKALIEHPAVEWIPLEMLNYTEFAQYFVTQNCDVFIAPLEDNRFNHAKSELKFLEYSALGIPGVYSRVTPYASIIEHGKNGFLASNLDEWADTLSYLVEHPAERFEIGIAAQQTTREEWTLSRHAAKWTDVYQQTMNSAQVMDAERSARYAVFSRVAQQIQERQRHLERENIRLSHELDVQTSRTYTLSDQLKAHIAEFNELRNQLNAIHQSRSWRLIKKSHQLRYWLVPLESRREKILQKLHILSDRS